LGYAHGVLGCSGKPLLANLRFDGI
ncbi:MAG: hypothetical protein JWM42_2605, partial [Burkholderia sp.]|nr:hypothetical protein [Burkholderia sp.]